MQPQVPKEFIQAIDNRQGGQFEAPPENINPSYGQKTNTNVFGETQAEQIRKRPWGVAAQEQTRLKKEHMNTPRQGGNENQLVGEQGLISAFNQSPSGVRFNNLIDALYREKATRGGRSRFEIDAEIDQLRADQRFAQDQWVGGGFMEARNNQAIQQKAVGDYLGGGAGGNKTTMQAPRGNKTTMQAPRGNGQAMIQGGSPDVLVQSPAMAQARKSWTPYDARTGRVLKGEELNNLYRNEYDLYKKAGGRPSEGVLNTNPIINREWNNSYNKNKRATEYSMANYQNPNAMSNYYQNLYS